MIRDDWFYLRKWVEYYGAQLGRENIYVLLDGLDVEVPAWCPGVNFIPCARVTGDVISADKGRIRLISSKAAELFDRYDLVIGTDVDEILVVDPRLGVGLQEFLSGLDIKNTVSGLGVDVGQRLDEEGDISEDVPFLRQRHYARLCTRYTKASVIAKPLEWGSGFHRVKGHNFHIAKDLYLFHFGYFDMARLKERFATRKEKGWERHLHKRSGTILACTRMKARNFDSSVRFARAMQTICRPPYALNKPAMFELKLIVRIPERFSTVV